MFMPLTQEELGDTDKVHDIVDIGKGSIDENSSSSGSSFVKRTLVATTIVVLISCLILSLLMGHGSGFGRSLGAGHGPFRHLLVNRPRTSTFGPKRQPVLQDILSSNVSGCLDRVGEADLAFESYVIVQIDNRMTADAWPVDEWPEKETIRASLIWNSEMATKLGYRYRLILGPKECKHPHIPEKLFPAICNQPALLIMASLFPNARGILFVGSGTHVWTHV